MPADQTFILAAFPTQPGEIIAAGVSETKGRGLLFLRRFTQANPAAELIPTREGISLPYEMYPELLAGVQALAAAAGESVVARIRKNKNHEIWIGAAAYKEKPLLFIRTYIYYGADPLPKPTIQGITIPAQQYPQLLDAVQKIQPALSEK